MIRIISGSAKGRKLKTPNTKIRPLSDQAKEALFNILDNAVKYTEPKGKINISITKYELYIRIDISDNGVGLDEEEYASIFKRFYRGNNTDDIEGIGLGLYLAREIITKQGGYIKVKSKKGVGSTFSVFLHRDATVEC